MKFKLFGITWDYSILVAGVYLAVGLGIVGYSFAISKTPLYLDIIWGIVTVLYLMTVKQVSELLIKSTD